MEYKLTVKNRLVLLSILPAQGSLLTIRIARELLEALSFGEAEHRDAQIENLEGGGVKWKEGAIPDKTVDVGPKAADMIRAALEKLDKEQKLTSDHLDLCDMFEYDG